MRFMASLVNKTAADADSVMSLAELWTKAHAACPCNDPNCNIVFRGGCGNGESEVDYTREGRVLRVYCMGCESNLLRVELPEFATSESGPRKEKLDEMRCACCKDDEPSHEIVMQQMCHPHAGKVVKYYRNRDHFDLICCKCDKSVARIHVAEKPAVKR